MTIITFSKKKKMKVVKLYNQQNISIYIEFIKY